MQLRTLHERNLAPLDLARFEVILMSGLQAEIAALEERLRVAELDMFLMPAALQAH